MAHHARIDLPDGSDDAWQYETSAERAARAATAAERGAAGRALAAYYAARPAAALPPCRLRRAALATALRLARHVADGEPAHPPSVGSG